MAAEVQPLPHLRQAPGPAPSSADQSYWKGFKNQILVPSPHNSSVTSITFPELGLQGTRNELFAVTSGSRVQIFNSKTRKLVKTIGRFGVDDIARSGVLRRDGRILLAGGDSGFIQAFDLGSRAILRQWRGDQAHKQPVHAIRWHPESLTSFMSCSDDRSLRIWDLSEDTATWKGLGHEDYVRSGAFLEGHNGNVLISGSYDRTVRIWDARQNGGAAAMAFKLASPVECVLSLNRSSVAAATGNEVAILNLVAGKAEHVLRSHQKTVSALCTAQQGARVLTGGLDGHVKVHSTVNWEVVASSKYPAPILSLAVVPAPAVTTSVFDDRHLAVGLQSGLLSIRTRLAGAEKVKTREKENKMQAMLEGHADEYDRKKKKLAARQGIRARDRGKDFRGEGADIVITGNERARPQKLQPWQRSLRAGKYDLALDQVLPPDRWQRKFERDDFLSLLTALRHRSALRTALEDRSADRLIPILTVLHKYILYPQYLDLLYDVLLILLDLYSIKMADWQRADGDAQEVDTLLWKINRRVKQAADWAQNAQRTLGMIEMLEMG